jgi:hypothetical protein
MKGLRKVGNRGILAAQAPLVNANQERKKTAPESGFLRNEGLL